MTFNVNINNTKTGEVLARTAANGLPVTSPVFDVSGLSRLSFGFIFEFGSGTLTRLDTGLEASYDGGATFMPVSINIDRGSPPDDDVQPGTAMKTLAAASENWCFEIGVSAFALVRLVLSAGTGAGAADDFLTVFAHGE